jgi:hypothetical protein
MNVDRKTVPQLFVHEHHWATGRFATCEGQPSCWAGGQGDNGTRNYEKDT